MSDLNESGIVTGTTDKDYNLVWYVYACLKNALRLETYRKDAQRAGDAELVELFTKAQADSRKGAELGKELLAARLGGIAAQPAAAVGTESGNEPPVDVMAPNQQVSPE